MAFYRLIELIFEVYFVVVLVRVLASWVPQYRAGWWVQLQGVCWALTEPLLRPIRRALAPMTGNTPLDLSPVVLILIMAVLERILLRLLVF